MKALSIRQPWAWAIVHAGKRIENRARKDGKMPVVCRHRGPLLIHASAGSTQKEYEEVLTWMKRTIDFWGLPVPPLRDLPRGGIVGVCNVVAHIEPRVAAWRDPDGTRPFTGAELDALDFRWRKPESYGLILADVRPLPFVRWKGQLGLFDVPGATPEDVVEAARREGRLRP